MTDWSRSTYLDLTSWNSYDYSASTTVEDAYDMDPDQVRAATDQTMVVGFVLPRANNPADLLEGNWAERQAALAKLVEDGTLWETYGAEATVYEDARTAIESAGGTIMEPADGYATSADSRTIWAELDPAAFQALLGAELYVEQKDPESEENTFWNGILTPNGLTLEGLFIEPDLESATQTLDDGNVVLEPGPQSLGNYSLERPSLKPQDFADVYNFPLSNNSSVSTVVGLMEPGLVNLLPDNSKLTFDEALSAYLRGAGLPDDEFSTYAVAPAGLIYDEDSAGERSLDVGVVAAVNPYGKVGLYSSANHSALAATYQLAIHDHVNDPAVLSSSFGSGLRTSYDSPFYNADEQLYVDAALANRTYLQASGDRGSGNGILTGLPNVNYDATSQYVLTVGGTSASNRPIAELDNTLDAIVEAALDGEKSLIWQLMQGSLKDVPADMDDDGLLIETVWNEYVLESDGSIEFLSNKTTTGGVDTRIEVPTFQTRYGLNPTEAGPYGNVGRGVPDVAAAAGGNTYYTVPLPDMIGTGGVGGTSAASPLWAALFQQLAILFDAQGLPRPGYAHDLLYQASVLTPASFNDVLFGHNTSTAAPGDEYATTNDDGFTVEIDATGLGYSATLGYDLTTGLGTPDGSVLASTMLAIAHSQMYSDVPSVLVEEQTGWTAGATGTLMFQVNSELDVDMEVSVDGLADDLSSATTDQFAWTPRIAGKTLDEDFSADLIAMFDGSAQANLFDADIDEGSTVEIEFWDTPSDASQADLTKDFGFVDFFGEEVNANTRVARPVAVAETIGGQDNQNFVVTMRQAGTHDMSLQLYEVDDFLGRINGIAPGEEGYAEAVEGRVYLTRAGEKWVDGGGFGTRSETEFANADAGDIIAMRLQSEDHMFYGFSKANESVDGDNVEHLWNYGHNMWGFEDLYGGGDRDFNDLVLHFDFAPY
ncbi:DUF4114 domain-containing protein [Chachezhania antarctica]|uniref:DUF4114 domain-containing protein n=1 Tax=Chachezhania antarctica TaxID=2340860 RepID=UPI000EAC6C34|nr:DUF4114 domain-containing protein [Chachezhania antarctica]